MNSSYAIIVLAVGLLSSCLSVKTPQQCLNQIVKAASHDRPESVWNCLTKQSQEAITEYRRLRDGLHAHNVPRDPLAVFVLQMKAERPQVTGVTYNPDLALAEILYANGLRARLVFKQEAGAWKLDLASELESTVELMEEALERLTAFQVAYETGQPIAKPSDDDD